jgi:hypothetical protein
VVVDLLHLLVVADLLKLLVLDLPLLPVAPRLTLSGLDLLRPLVVALLQ